MARCPACWATAAWVAREDPGVGAGEGAAPSGEGERLGGADRRQVFGGVLEQLGGEAGAGEELAQLLGEGAGLGVAGCRYGTPAVTIAHGHPPG